MPPYLELLSMYRCTIVPSFMLLSQSEQLLDFCSLSGQKPQANVLTDEYKKAVVKQQRKHWSMNSEMGDSILPPLRDKKHSTTVEWENQRLLYVTTPFYEHKLLSETLWTRYKAESCLSPAHMQEKLYDSEM